MSCGPATPRTRSSASARPWTWSTWSAATDLRRVGHALGRASARSTTSARRRSRSNPSGSSTTASAAARRRRDRLRPGDRGARLPRGRGGARRALRRRARARGQTTRRPRSAAGEKERRWADEAAGLHRGCPLRHPLTLPPLRSRRRPRARDHPSWRAGLGEEEPRAQQPPCRATLSALVTVTASAPAAPWDASPRPSWSRRAWPSAAGARARGREAGRHDRSAAASCSRARRRRAAGRSASGRAAAMAEGRGPIESCSTAVTEPHDRGCQVVAFHLLAGAHGAAGGSTRRSYRRPAREGEADRPARPLHQGDTAGTSGTRLRPGRYSGGRMTARRSGRARPGVSPRPARTSTSTSTRRS